MWSGLIPCRRLALSACVAGIMAPLWPLFLLLMLASPGAATLTIFNSNTSQEAVSISTYAVLRTVRFGVIEAPILMLANPTNKNPEMQDLDLNGRIVILERMDVNNFELWATSNAVKQENISAVVLIDTEIRSLGSLSSEISYSTKIPFPVALIEEKHRAELWTLFNSSSAPILARLGSDSLKSPWTEALQSPVFWGVVCFLAMLQLALLVLCAGRIVQFTRIHTTFTAKAAIAIILTEICGAVIRLIYWGVDPFGQRGVFSDPVRKSFHTAPLVFSLIATLFVTLYWHAILKGSQARFSWSMEQFRTPAFLIGGILLLFEIIIDSLVLSGFILRPLDLIRSIVYLTVAISLMAFFSITGVRVLRILAQLAGRETSDENSVVYARHRSFTVKIIISNLFIIGTIAAGFITVIPAYSTHWIPAWVISAWFVMHFLVTCKGFITVYALLPVAARSPTAAAGVGGARRHKRAAMRMNTAIEGAAATMEMTMTLEDSSAPLSFTPMQTTDSHVAHYTMSALDQTSRNEV